MLTPEIPISVSEITVRYYPDQVYNTVRFDDLRRLARNRAARFQDQGTEEQRRWQRGNLPTATSHQRIRLVGARPD